MLEDLHNVERRVDMPHKKVKRLSDDLESVVKPKTSYAHRGNGIIGEYMRPDSASGQLNQPIVPKAVDLTTGELRDRYLTNSLHDPEPVALLPSNSQSYRPPCCSIPNRES
jgi:hypothetical protein